MTDVQDITSMPKPFTWREVHERIHAKRNEMLADTGRLWPDGSKLLLALSDRGDLFRDVGEDPAKNPSLNGSVLGVPFEFRAGIPSRQMVIRWEVDL